MPSADAPPAEAPPKKATRWLVPLAALLIGSAGAAAFTQSDTLRQTVGLAAPDSAAAAAEPIEYGEFTELDGIVINPRGTDGRRYLMVRLGVEAEDAETLSRLDLVRPAAIDAVIDLLAQQQVEALTDVTHRDSLKDEIRNRFNKILGEDGPVTRVYFTQYVLQ